MTFNHVYLLIMCHDLGGGGCTSEVNKMEFITTVHSNVIVNKKIKNKRRERLTMIDNRIIDTCIQSAPIVLRQLEVSRGQWR